ncbi:Nucleotide-binding universal stress protein, UspA family [Halomicrobium zhouii]|uniref:Nucleotide-binding universal stress protein, UspA family n=1 Tax=Halomicrobium zhouii TaxID=767519 RepID=A0A1I6LAK7_9EURY|nr:universal stress protein [Halomicrobium zhouii]SFS00444.1 Nucleotide-binding universal stress protein, UspA family [Halomicrobium zhouii]
MTSTSELAGTAAPAFSDLLLPTDGTKRMTRVVDLAIDVASQFGARLHVLYVVDAERGRFTGSNARQKPFQWGDVVTGDVAELARYRGVEPVTVIREGVPHEVILDYAREAAVDLIVVGIDRPRTVVGYAADLLGHTPMGTTSSHVIYRAQVPVLSVRV